MPQKLQVQVHQAQHARLSHSTRRCAMEIHRSNTATAGRKQAADESKV